MGVEAVGPRFRVAIDAGGRAVRGLALGLRLVIRAERRRYEPGEAEALAELFGPVAEWGRSLGGVPWASAAIDVGPFEGSTTVALPVPRTDEPDAAAAKYLAALDGGEVPVELLFSGTVRWTGPGGRAQAALIPWDREASFRLPPAVWREVVPARDDVDVLARLRGLRARAQERG